MHRPATLALLAAITCFAGQAGAAERPLICTLKSAASFRGETVACYSEAQCAIARSSDGDPVLGFDKASAPYALARGKIIAIVAAEGPLTGKAKSLGAVCRVAQNNPASHPATAGPSFDCKKASHEIEQLICNDNALSALDRKLNGQFERAGSNLSAEQRSELRSEQRGWVKGRNECWKASDKAACTRDIIVRRIAFLGARYGLAEVGKSVRYSCAGSDDIIFTPVATDPPSANLVRGNDAQTLIAEPSGSGMHYVGEFGVEFWSKGDDAMVEWPQGKKFDCKAIP